MTRAGLQRCRIVGRLKRGLCGAGLLLASGCAAPKSSPPADLSSDAPPPNVADNAFTPVAALGNPAPARPAANIVQVALLQVLVPVDQLPSADLVWNHVREDLFDADTSVRLRANGLRVGVGHEQWWSPIRAVLEGLEGADTLRPEPQAVRPDLPLLLELDEEPRDQLLFAVDDAGTLSGSSWPASRNALRIQAATDGLQAEQTALRVLPLVQQREEGTRWSRDEDRGPWRLAPNQRVAALTAAAFEVRLAAGEFLLLAPSESAGVTGLLGNAFLMRERDGRRFAMYLFLQPEGGRVSRRNE